MKIWIDGDACPRVIKDILFRSAMRTQTPLMMVANHLVSVPQSPWITRMQVGAGFDKVDQTILDNMQAGELIITADIPFADAAITQGAQVLNPRGQLYTAQNIKQYLSIRNIHESLRSFSRQGGPSTLHKNDIQSFANRLDTLLTRCKKT